MVLTGAFAIPFLSFAAHTILPVLAAAVAVFPFLLLVQFRSRRGGARGPGEVWIPIVVDVRGLGAGQEEVELESHQREGVERGRQSTSGTTSQDLNLQDRAVTEIGELSEPDKEKSIHTPTSPSDLSPSAVCIVHRNISTTASNRFVPGTPDSEIIGSSTNLPPPRTTVVPAPTLAHPKSTIFGAFLLLATLFVLLGVSTLNVPVWEVTVPPAVIMLLRDVWWDVRTSIQQFAKKASGSDSPSERESSKGTRTHSIDANDPFSTPQTTPPPLTRGGCLAKTLPPRALFKHTFSHPSTSLPTITHILPRLPLSLIPFSFCMFILVQSLASKGWVDVFAHWWRAWTELCLRGGEPVGVLGAVVGMMVVGIIMCNVSLVYLTAFIFNVIINPDQSH